MPEPSQIEYIIIYIQLWLNLINSLQFNCVEPGLGSVACGICISYLTNLVAFKYGGKQLLEFSGTFYCFACIKRLDHYKYRLLLGGQLNGAKQGLESFK